MISRKIIFVVLGTALVACGKHESDVVDPNFKISQYIDILELKTADCDYCGMTFFGAVSIKVISRKMLLLPKNSF